MDTWFQKVKEDLTVLPDFLEYYNTEYQEAKKDVRLLNGGSLERIAASLPHLTEQRFSQLQDIEAILEHLNIHYRKMRSNVFQKWFENQKVSRALTAKECDKYVDGDSDVNDLAELINEVALLRNLFLSILKGLDNKSYQINNITKLKAAGLEDSKI
jgi:hypothetical protein